MEIISGQSILEELDEFFESFAICSVRLRTCSLSLATCALRSATYFSRPRFQFPVEQSVAYTFFPESVPPATPHFFANNNVIGHTRAWASKDIFDIAMGIECVTCKLLFYGWLCWLAKLENQAQGHEQLQNKMEGVLEKLLLI